MFKHMLVPLDTSHFAEAALPYAQGLAERFDAKITLACVIETPLYMGDEFISTAQLEAAARESALSDAKLYLKGVAGVLRQQGYNVELKIAEGRQIAEEIIQVATEVGADVIVMSTHGRSGLGRWLLGSVADKILRHADIPVLLIRSQENSEPMAWRRGGEETAVV